MFPFCYFTFCYFTYLFFIMLSTINEQNDVGDDTTCVVQRKKCFYTVSPEYHELVQIFVDKDWRNLTHLPRSGAVVGRPLDAFLRKYAFSRAQVTPKFKLWKKSFERERDIKQLDQSKIEDVDGLYRMVKEREPWKTQQQRKVSYYTTISCTYEIVFDDPLFVQQLKLLRFNFIEEVNKMIANPQLSNATKSQRYRNAETKCINEYVDSALIEFLESDHVSPYLLGNLALFVKVQGKAALFCLASEFVKCFSVSIKRGGHGNSTMVAMVEDSLSKHDPALIDLTVDSLLRQTIYNISGWLVKAIEKAADRMVSNQALKIAPKKIAECARFVSVESAKESNLPTAKVEDTISKVPLRFASASFFRFVLVVESVCEKVMVERSILIFGSDIVNELSKVIVDIPHVRATVRNCCNEHDALTPNEVGPVTEFLIAIYMKIRSNDYIRQIIAKTNKSLTPGTRSTLAVIAEGGLVAHVKKRKE